MQDGGRVKVVVSGPSMVLDADIYGDGLVRGLRSFTDVRQRLLGGQTKCPRLCCDRNSTSSGKQWGWLVTSHGTMEISLSQSGFTRTKPQILGLTWHLNESIPEIGYANDYGWTFKIPLSAGYLVGLAPAIADEVAVFRDILLQKCQETSDGRSKVFRMEELTVRMTFGYWTSRARHSTELPEARERAGNSFAVVHRVDPLAWSPQPSDQVSDCPTDSSLAQRSRDEPLYRRRD